MTRREKLLLKNFMEKRPQIQALVYTICGDYHLSEDILQESVMTLLDKADDFDPSRPFLPWALGIARFKTLETLRRHSQNRRLIISEETALRVQEALLDELNANSLEERTSAMIHCLNRLKPEHRLMMKRKYLEGSGVNSIARELGKSFSSVQSQILRLRHKLRQCIEQQAEPG